MKTWKKSPAVLPASANETIDEGGDPIQEEVPDDIVRAGHVLETRIRRAKLVQE